MKSSVAKQNSSNSFLRGFSSPSFAFPVDYVEIAANTFAKVLFDELSQKFYTNFDLAFSTLLAKADEIPEHSLSFNETWCPAIGTLAEAIRSGNYSNARSAVIDYAIQSLSTQENFAWDGPIDPSYTHQWSAEPLPRGKHISISSESGNVAISVDGVSVAPIPRSNASSRIPIQVDDEDSSEYSPKGTNEIILHSSSTSEALFPDIRPRFIAGSSQTASKNVSKALELLENSSSGYADWVKRVLRQVVPMSRKEGLYLSASYRHRPGLIALSVDASPTILSELLVHETSHQYLYMLNNFGPIENGLDKEEYYSPVKGTKRPLYFILLAYHAFANIWLYHNEALGSGTDGDRLFSEKRIKEIQPILEEFEKILANTSGLTEFGCIIWQPLANLISTHLNQDVVAGA